MLRLEWQRSPSVTVHSVAYHPCSQCFHRSTQQVVATRFQCSASQLIITSSSAKFREWVQIQYPKNPKYPGTFHLAWFLGSHIQPSTCLDEAIGPSSHGASNANHRCWEAARSSGPLGLNRHARPRPTTIHDVSARLRGFGCQFLGDRYKNGERRHRYRMCNTPFSHNPWRTSLFL